jgi:hypothetical protein
VDLSSPFRLGILPILGNASMLKKDYFILIDSDDKHVANFGDD